MPSATVAVLIADVMASSKRRDVRALLAKKLTAASKRHLDQKLIRLPYAVTAGDEFQTVVGGLASLPALLLDLRSSFQPLSLRVGIGIGRIADRIQPPVNRLSGEAFQFARRAIENVKSRRLFKFDVLTAFASGDQEFDGAINLIYGLHDTLVLQITRKQWSAIEIFLSRPKLERAARRLQRDTSTVSRSLKRGYYWQLAETARVAGSVLEKAFR
jgi:SatD family (SatD)